MKTICKPKIGDEVYYLQGDVLLLGKVAGIHIDNSGSHVDRSKIGIETWTGEVLIFPLINVFDLEGAIQWCDMQIDHWSRSLENLKAKQYYRTIDLLRAVD